MSKTIFQELIIHLGILGVVSLCPVDTFAQGIISQINNDAVFLTEEVFIAGGCFDVENAMVSGGKGAIGTFTQGLESIGIESGIVLSTGSVLNVVGPNTQTNYTTNFNLLNPDLDLEMIIGNPNIPIQDVAILEFDFTPTSDLVTFEYVFASEEYCDFVNTLYNDVFGFFISGPGINGPFSNGAENIARIPGTADFVAINNVNHLTNSGYFIDNIPLDDPQINNCPGPYPNTLPAAAAFLEFDGFTHVMSSSAQVQPCETYQIKLVVGDVTDGQYDSAVFLKANSFEAGQTVIIEAFVPSTESNITYEGCNDAYFLFQRFGSGLENILTVDFNLSSSSTAIPGQDFVPLPLEVTFGPGQSIIELPVDVIPDGVAEGQETLTIEMESSCSCFSTLATLIINDGIPIQGNLNSVEACVGESVFLEPEISGGIPPYDFLWGDGSVEAYNHPIVGEDQVVSLQVTDNCGSILYLESEILSNPIPTAQMFDSIEFCNIQDGAELPVFLEGDSPWQLTYSINNVLQETVIINESPYFLPASIAGQYFLEYLESNGCVGYVEGTSMVSFSDLEIVPIVHNVSCHGLNDGEILLNVSGGNAPYSFLWHDGFTNENRVDLSPGIYYVSITDANGCLHDHSFEITEPEVFEMAVQVTPVNCHGEYNGQISIQTFGGTAPYTYQINDSVPQGEPFFQDLYPGQYSVKVRDAQLCELETTVMVSEPEPLSVLIQKIEPECTGMNTGIIQVVPLGGVGDYSYRINDGFYQSDPVFFDLEPAQYQVELIDGNGCSFNIPVELYAPDAFSVSHEIQLPTCNLTPDGLVEVLVENALDPISYSINGTPLQQENTFSGLTPGEYTILVQDQTGCQVTFSVSLENPNTSEVIIHGPDRICPDETGVLHAFGNFQQFYWSTGDVGDSLTVLSAGHYEVTAVDEENCWSISDHWVESVPITEFSIVGDSILCEGEPTVLTLDQEFQWAIWNGGAESDYLWVSEPGIYAVSVTDDYGCEGQAFYSVWANTVETVEILGSLTFCEGGTTTLQVSGDFMDWIWSDGSEDPFLVVSDSGDYHITAFDLNGCKSVDTVEVRIADFLTPEIIGPVGICPNDSIELSIVEDYANFYWSNGAVESNTHVFQEGQYSVTVQDENGCSGSDSIYVVPFPTVQPEITGDSGFCFPGSSQLSVTGNFLQILWSNNSIDTLTEISQSGWAFVTAVDSNGCQGTDSIFIENHFPGVNQFQQTICEGETYWFADDMISIPGQYMDTLFGVAQNGCDSLVVLDLEVLNTSFDTLFASVAEGENFYFNGDWKTEPGWYSDTLDSHGNGCDSIVMLFLEVVPYFAVYDTLELGICFGDSFEFNGQVYTAQGVFRDTTFSNSTTNPDTVYLIILEQFLSDTIEVVHEVCMGDSLFLYGFWHKKDTIFFDRLTTVHGCDSMVITKLIFSDLEVVVEELSSLLCFGDSTGIIGVEVTGASDEFELLWSTGSTQSKLERLPYGQYQVTVTDHLGCIQIESILLDQPEKLKASITVDLDCHEPGKANLIITDVLGGTPPFIYGMRDDIFQLSNSFEVPAPSVQNIVVEDIHGCRLDVLNIEVDSILKISLATTDTIIQFGDSLELHALPNFDFHSIVWSPAEPLSCFDCQAPVAFPERTTTFSVSMKTADGCWVENYLTVYVDHILDVYVPNVFSPNGDGINDHFFLYAGENVESIQLFEVYDRWGNLVYRQRNLSIGDETSGWDGFFNGIPVSQGVYVYRAELKTTLGEIQELSGDLLLMRR